jgi:hypothetical protein
VRASELTALLRAAAAKKGSKLAGNPLVDRVTVERVPATRCARILHVGPYADEARSFEQLRARIAADKVKAAPAHLEVYLNDPRRTRPERLRTVLLIELA